MKTEGRILAFTESDGKDRFQRTSACINSRFNSRYGIYLCGAIEVIWIMEKTNLASARIWWLSDNTTVVYLDSLRVESASRKKGLGTELQEMRENIGRALGAHIARLSVKKDSWMHGWCERRGYKDYRFDSNCNYYVWMQKSLA